MIHAGWEKKALTKGCFECREDSAGERQAAFRHLAPAEGTIGVAKPLPAATCLNLAPKGESVPTGAGIPVNSVASK